MQQLQQEELLLAYHDRSDGGVLVTLIEMALAGRCGLNIEVPAHVKRITPYLFHESLGAVWQIRESDYDRVMAQVVDFGLQDNVIRVASVSADSVFRLMHQQQEVLAYSIFELHALWSKTSYNMQAMRDNPVCAEQAYVQVSDSTHQGLTPHLTFDPEVSVAAPYLSLRQPKVAILREQGVNGQMEMAAAFSLAGFSCVDVSMSDLLSMRQDLSDFQGLAVCGGFSYGDVLGAGRGWAQVVALNNQLRDMFTAFFQREDTFTLGVCNGCQMLSQLKDLIPGASHWPTFKMNDSRQFESRLLQVKVCDSPSMFFSGMQESVIPVVVAHAEGRVDFASGLAAPDLLAAQQLSLQYVNSQHNVTVSYPDNPNGSEQGIAGCCSKDGRALIMMPHPERLFRTVQYSWHPREWGERGPWLRMFENARQWIG